MLLCRVPTQDARIPFRETSASPVGVVGDGLCYAAFRVSRSVMTANIACGSSSRSLMTWLFFQ